MSRKVLTEEQFEKSGGAGHVPEEDRKCMCKDSKGRESLPWSRSSEEGWMAGVEGKRDRKKEMRVEGNTGHIMWEPGKSV